MEGLILFVHIVVCFLLVVVVLLQSGKAADLAGAFGGAGTQSTFGPRGTATLLSKMTTILAVLFMITSLTLWLIAYNKGSSKSLLSPGDVKPQQTEQTQPKTQPAADKTADQPAPAAETSPGTQTETENKSDTSSKKEPGDTK